MKKTQILFKQHLQRQFKQKWTAMGQIRVQDKNAKEDCESRGLKVYDPMLELDPKITEPQTDLTSVAPPATLGDIPAEFPRNPTNPNWKDVPVHCYNAETLLPGGLEQAQCLTNSVVVHGFPKKVQDLVEDPLAQVNDDIVERLIMRSHILDAVQDKLPRIYNGPWMINPRKGLLDYGPTKRRRNHNMVQQMITSADRVTSSSKPELCSRVLRKLPESAVTLDVHGKKMLFHVEPPALLLSHTPLAPYADSSMVQELSKMKLPDIYPIAPTAHILETNLYEDQSKLYVGLEGAKRAPHIHFAFFTSDIYKKGEIDPPTKPEADMLVNSFAIAVAQAKLLYGLDVKTLPHPVTINTAHFELSRWLFGSYQLNTLDVSEENTKNIFWLQRTPEVFTESKVIAGRPTLGDFNAEFYRHFLALYSSS